MFKVGDKVEALTDYPEHDGRRIIKGMRGVVLDPKAGCDLDSTLMHVMFDNGIDELMFSYRFKLVKEEKEEMFGKKDLKTGYIVEVVAFNQVQFAMVLLDTTNGDIIAGETWFPLSSYSDEELFGSNNNARVKINKVYRPKLNQDYGHAITKSLKDQIPHCSLVWERKEKTEQQKQIEELEKTILLAKQQIETLKKGE